MPNNSAANIARWAAYHENFSAHFWKRVRRSENDGECWPYQGSTRANGYGRLRLHGRYELAHRIAYSLAMGANPDSLMVCHTCDNPPCCNPKHLFLGTHQQNVDDCVAKGRRPTGDVHVKTKLSDQIVERIRASADSGVAASELAKTHNVHYSTIRRILSGKTRTALRAREAAP